MVYAIRLFTVLGAQYTAQSNLRQRGSCWGCTMLTSLKMFVGVPRRNSPKIEIADQLRKAAAHQRIYILPRAVNYWWLVRNPMQNALRDQYAN